ncbi:hypothetical protein ABKN59_001979 [Abortiporus biennis]
MVLITPLAQGLYPRLFSNPTIIHGHAVSLIRSFHSSLHETDKSNPGSVSDSNVPRILRGQAWFSLSQMRKIDMV